MAKLSKTFVYLVVSIFLLFSLSYATTEQLKIEMNEYVDQTVYFDPLYGPTSGTWADADENQSYYNLTGYIIISNTNPNEPIADIYLEFDNTNNITLPTLDAGRTGTWLDNDPTDGTLYLHIPEILPGETSNWTYSINDTLIRPPLNFTSDYSDYKILAGENISITDTLQNNFDNLSYQTNSCIYDINITQSALAVDFLGTPYYFGYVNNSQLGSDGANVSFSGDLRTLYWDVRAGSCLNLSQTTDIIYNVTSPYNIPTSNTYQMINATFEYKLNETVSHLRLMDIFAISEGNVSFEKQILAPSDPILYGSNVTWNVTGYFSTGANITYDLNTVTFWVSQRNVNGSFTDPNTIDNDSISNTSLQLNLTPGTTINSTNKWISTDWLFNYSDIPSPIVWMDINFSITNDGTQLINRSVTQNGNDYYVKELYLIIGYWLEIEKNITSVGSDTYAIKIDVHNKGNQVTPAGSIVTIYDFVPSNFNITSNFTYSSSSWYNTTRTNNTVSGEFNGTLQQWALIPNNALNTSLDQGPAKNSNTTWSAEFNVTGLGDYTLLDVFVTGLDPQKVDGAGSTRAVVVEEVLDRLKSTEGIFAVVASVLLLLGLLL